MTITPGNIFEEPKTIRVKGLNYGTKIGAPLSTKITLEGSGQPYILNTWSGEITPIAHYTSNGKQVTVDIRLDVDESMLIGISKDPAHVGLSSSSIYVQSTDADGVLQSKDGSLSILANKAGTYHTTFSDGKSVQTKLGATLDKMDLTQGAWKLTVEDWQPKNKYGSLGASGAETAKPIISLDLTSLKAWPDIDALKNVSGIGTYTYNLTLPNDWTSEKNGAKISLGQVVDTFTLTVNGQVIAIDQISAVADVGNSLKAGENKIEIRVATTLNNKLHALNKAVADRGIIQEYGLVGPVILQPYTKAIVWSK
jgi:hypothetical protein